MAFSIKYISMGISLFVKILHSNRFYNNNPNSPAFKNITIRSYEDSNSELSLSITD